METNKGNAQRIILHVDLNSFFATAEQQANPYLRGKPVGIIKASGRTCIIAASVEAKKYGVVIGSRVFDAKKLCPQIILVPADFDKYADITYRFINICKSYSPICEVFSLDECFIDVTESEKFWGHAFNIAFEIKERIRREIGDYLTCSIGVSYNRLLAKLASEQIKPDGLFWITEDNVFEVLDSVNLTDVCGLGFGLWRHLKLLGIDSFANLRSKSLEFLHKHFGPYWSLHLYNIARGIDNSPVVAFSTLADAKSVGRTYTTHRNLYNKSEVERLMRNLCEETAAKARQMGLAGRYVGISLRGGEQSFYGHRTLKKYVDDGKDFFDICLSIADGLLSSSSTRLCRGSPKATYRSGQLPYVRFCGVTLGMLTKKDYLPLPFFPSERRRQALVSAVDKLNRDFGEYTVFPGQLLGMPIIRPELNGFFGDKKYRLNFTSPTTGVD